jgi:hypothetical protein
MYPYPYPYDSFHFLPDRLDIRKGLREHGARSHHTPGRSPWATARRSERRGDAA